MVEPQVKYPWINAHSDYGFEILHQQKTDQAIIFRKKHLPLLQANNVKLEVVQVGGDFMCNGVDGHDSLSVFSTIDAVLQVVEQNNDICQMIFTQKDLRDVLQSNKIGFLLSMEGSSAIDRDLRFLRNFYRLGVRNISMTHNERNIFGDGLHVKHPGGLSPFGEQYVHELNQMDMIFDLVHLSEKCFFEVLEIYEKAPIISHGNVKSVYDCLRASSDAQIQAIIDRKGFFGLNFIARFIGPADRREITVDDLINQIDYIVNKFGPDHIGLGPDWVYYMEGGWEEMKYAGDIRDENAIGIFFSALENRGYSSKEIKKIAYENFQRYFESHLQK